MNKQKIEVKEKSSCNYIVLIPLDMKQLSTKHSKVVAFPVPFFWTCAHKEEGYHANTNN